MAGVDWDSPFTPAELYRMAKTKAKAEWDRTAQISYLLYHTHAKKKRPMSDFHPLMERPKVKRMKLRDLKAELTGKSNAARGNPPPRTRGH